MERVRRIRAEIIGALGGLALMVPLWPPDNDAERAVVAIAGTIVVLSVAALLVEIGAWVARRGDDDSRRVMIASGAAINAVNSTVIVANPPVPLPTAPADRTPPPRDPPPLTADEAAALIAAGEPVALVQPDGRVLVPPVIRNHTFRLSELPLGTNAVHGQEFEDCVIYGPVAIALRGTTSFVECFWEATGSTDSILWEMPEGKVIDGALILEDCTFRRCTFRLVAIVGAKQTLDRFRDSTPAFQMPPRTRGQRASP